MDAKALIQDLLMIGQSGQFEKINGIPGAGDHEYVAGFVSKARRDVRRIFKNLNSEEKQMLVKSIAVFEDTVGGIGIPSLLEHLIPELVGDERKALDWVLKNTNSYWWYSKNAKSLFEYDETIRLNKERRERSLAKEKERELEAKKRKADKATLNLPNAVKRGDAKAIKALIRKGADVSVLSKQ